MLQVLIFIMRFLKHLLLFACVLLPLQVLGALILLPYIYIKRKWFTSIKMGKSSAGQRQLPYILRWFDNADIYYYIDRDYSTYIKVWQQGWWSQYCWLAWRNPLNYFGYKILGIVAINSIIDDNIGDSAGNLPGFRYLETPQGYEYYYIKKWSASTCFRFRMGHKLAGAKSGQYCEYVGVIQPYKSYSGM